MLLQNPDKGAVIPAGYLFGSLKGLHQASGRIGGTHRAYYGRCILTPKKLLNM